MGLQNRSKDLKTHEMFWVSSKVALVNSNKSLTL